MEKINMKEKFISCLNALLPWLAEWYPALIIAIVFLILCSPRLTIKIAAAFMRLIMFRLRVMGKENMPYSGPILLVSNHVSLVDLLMIQCVIRPRVRFLVRQEILEITPQENVKIICFSTFFADQAHSLGYSQENLRTGKRIFIKNVRNVIPS